MPEIGNGKGRRYRVPPGTAWTSRVWENGRRMFRVSNALFKSHYGLYNRDLEVMTPLVWHFHEGIGPRTLVSWVGAKTYSCMDLSGLALVLEAAHVSW